MNAMPQVLIAAGGTGGHVFPALAVGECLAGAGFGLHWCGTRHGLEARVVPGDRYRMHWLPGQGVRGRSVFRRMRAATLLLLAAVQSIWLMLRVRPSVVLAMGGYVSAPVGVAAFLTRRPLVVHEQNAIPGMTNRILARLASRVLEAVPGSFAPARGATHVGNPVRREIAALAERSIAGSVPADVPCAGNAAGNDAADAPLTLLIFGGSQGAQSINRALPVVIAEVMRTAGATPTEDHHAIEAQKAPTIAPPAMAPVARRAAHTAIPSTAGCGPFRVIHQTGSRNLPEVKAAYAACKVDAEVLEFIEDMAGAYGRADIVVARAGAMSVAEILVAGLPSILIPYPHAVDDHQRANAAALVKAGAAFCIADAEIESAEFRQMLASLINDGDLRARMRAAASTLAMPDAALRVAEIIQALAGAAPFRQTEDVHG